MWCEKLLEVNPAKRNFLPSWFSMMLKTVHGNKTVLALAAIAKSMQLYQ